jgi:glycosyltransferase involved in cell wall biosynthesis
MKLAVVCCTYARPKLLAEAIESFLRQDYPAHLREMIVLDDAGQYAAQSGNGWAIVSIARRFRTLGEKRNAAAALTSPDADAYVVWDDDDIYLPRALTAHAAALQQAEWSLPGEVFVERRDGTLQRRESRGMFHSGWAYSRAAFQRVGGYPFMQSGQDQGLARRFRRAGISPTDPLAGQLAPQLIYRWQTTSCWHLSALDRATGYQQLTARAEQRPRNLSVRPNWRRDYAALAHQHGKESTRP